MAHADEEVIEGAIAALVDSTWQWETDLRKLRLSLMSVMGLRHGEDEASVNFLARVMQDSVEDETREEYLE